MQLKKLVTDLLDKIKKNERLRRIKLRVQAFFQGKVYLFHDVDKGTHTGLEVDIRYIKGYKPGKSAIEVIVPDGAVLHPPVSRRGTHDQCLHVFGGIDGDNVLIVNRGVMCKRAY